MKIALVFPGQGSQFVGMGKDLYDNFEIARDVYREASEALGYDIADLSFNGPKEELNKTYRTQPSLLTASYAAFRVLSTEQLSPDYAAGHSLGEYSAAAAAGVFSFRDAVMLAEKRGHYMQDAVPAGKGLMAAIIGLDREAISRICSSVTSGYAAPANINCPDQIVIAGERHAVEEAIQLANEAGARRALTLAVSVPSHCRLMEAASRRLSTLIDQVDFRTPMIPLVNNADAAFLTDSNRIKASFVRQLNNPLLWEDSIKLMAATGVDTFIEVGPKKVLSGLIRRITSQVNVYNVEDSRSFAVTVNALKEMVIEKVAAAEQLQEIEIGRENNNITVVKPDNAPKTTDDGKALPDA